VAAGQVDQEPQVDDTPLQMRNASLLQDEMLMQVVQVLEGDYPLGPSFMQALGSVVEAAVLHEANYFDISARFQQQGVDGLQSRVRGSDFVTELMAGAAVQPFPPAETVDLVLGQIGADEDMLGFIADINWTGGGAAFTDISFETRHCEVLATMLDRHPVLFRQLDLTDDDDMPTVPNAGALIDDGMTRDRLIFLEGQNHRLAALVRLTQLLQLNLYTNVASVPHQIGMIGRSNGAARRLYETLEKELATTDDDIGVSAFKTIPVPGLARLVLERSRGDPRALAAETLRLRERHQALRTYLTDFDEAWAEAGSRRERLKLQADFDNAWQQLVRDERRPRERSVYKIWDVFKSPTGALAALGDLLADAGRRRAVTGQVRGLHAFWTDLADAPAAKDNIALAAKLGLGLATDDVWQTHQRMGAAMACFVAAS
jgi:hypothetical protein